MKTTLTAMVTMGVAVTVFGYTVELTSTADKVVPGDPISTVGWSSRTTAHSASATHDFRQMSFFDSVAYAGTFNSKPPTGWVVIIR